MAVNAMNTQLCQSLQGPLLNTCDFSELEKPKILTSYIHLFLLKLECFPLIKPMV